MAILRILLIVFLKLKKIVNQESFVRPKTFIRNSAQIKLIRRRKIHIFITTIYSDFYFNNIICIYDFI